MRGVQESFNSPKANSSLPYNLDAVLSRSSLLAYGTIHKRRSFKKTEFDFMMYVSLIKLGLLLKERICSQILFFKSSLTLRRDINTFRPVIFLGGVSI